jgi:proline iminopeptidase
MLTKTQVVGLGWYGRAPSMLLSRRSIGGCGDIQLLRDVSRIGHIPGVIVQGRYDVVCPMESAWALHSAWPEAEMIITADGGHSATDPANNRALVAATDRFAG